MNFDTKIHCSYVSSTQLAPARARIDRPGQQADSSSAPMQPNEHTALGKQPQSYTMLYVRVLHERRTFVTGMGSQPNQSPSLTFPLHLNL